MRSASKAGTVIPLLSAQETMIWQWYASLLLSSKLLGVSRTASCISNDIDISQSLLFFPTWIHTAEEEKHVRVRVRSLKDIRINGLGTAHFFGRVQGRGPQQLHGQRVHVVAIGIQNLTSARPSAITGNEQSARVRSVIVEIRGDGLGGGFDFAQGFIPLRYALIRGGFTMIYLIHSHGCQDPASTVPSICPG